MMKKIATALLAACLFIGIGTGTAHAAAPNVDIVRCPKPRCGRRILDIEVEPPGKVVLEVKCLHCGEVVRVSHNPERKKGKVHKRNRRQE